jgi:predicted MPP superfamily phosphohydrolase
LRIGYVSDTHVGPMMRARDVERALETLFASRPALLLLGGDYVCESPRFISEAAAVIGDYAALAPRGALAVLGNHDYSNDAPRLMAQLERRGIQVLVNDAARIPTADGDVWVVGIDDAMLSTPDLECAFHKVPPDAPTIVLWHEPDLAHQTARFEPIIQLSGHSHGGQIRLPKLGHVAAPAGGRRYVAGMHVVDGMRVYTSRGVGVYRPPVRFRCPPEVTLLTLT